jgi:5-formyltetrahydrofolate cyclo-ligase
MTLTIDQIRQDIRQRRRRLGLGAQQRAAFRLLRTIKNSYVYRSSQSIAFYLPSGGELDCRPLLKQAWRDGKHCYLPLIGKGPEPSMSFTRYLPGGHLKPNRFNILEPVSKSIIVPQALDLVIVPLVGFDGKGNRIGMGGGYYDRTFAFTAYSTGPALLGVAYHFQQVQKIETRQWDVQLDSIVSV